MKALFGLFLVFAVGCTAHNDPAVMATNATTLSGAGEPVGTLPDGRRIVRYRLEMGSNTKDHWVYITDNTITINREERHGKHTNNHVDVIVDGVHYTPAR